MAARKNAVTFEEILDDLDKKIYYPVYFLFGEEPYFIDEITGYLENNILTEGEKEFNLTVLYGKDVSVADIIGYARRYPMMSNYQVIIVKEAQEVKNIEELEVYLQHPLASTLLVICYKYEKADRRKSFFKLVEKTGVLYEAARLYDNRIPDWITAWLAKRKYPITAKASFLLTEFLGNDLAKIVNELDKLTINVPAGQEITEELVERNIGISKDFNVFELQKALGRKDVVKANQIISYFAANPRENPLVKVIPILYSFFSKLLLYHCLGDKSKNSVAAALSINPFFVQDYQAAARNYPAARLISLIPVLREYDLKAKGVDNQLASDGELMKEMIFRILH
ncbi:MAG TPA: DNA polymerase III subunit delta [Bacteroidales bacterium]|nr:DNA polymerase III subunit delta [Bacteroidales bacterium]